MIRKMICCVVGRGYKWWGRGWMTVSYGIFLTFPNIFIHNNLSPFSMKAIKKEGYTSYRCTILNSFPKEFIPRSRRSIPIPLTNCLDDLLSEILQLIWNQLGMTCCCDRHEECHYPLSIPAITLFPSYNEWIMFKSSRNNRSAKCI